jgi:acyl-CoA reductase-like NAD-dependent aldehyde dehydrogenase
MEETSEKTMHALINRQREAFIASRPEPLTVRRDRPGRRSLSLIGASAEVRHEPKGIIGIVAPWNSRSASP